MGAQLDDKARKALHININNRINAAHEEIAKISTKLDKEGKPELDEAGKPVRKKPEELTAKERKNIEYLNDRIQQLQVSIRLVFNTDWLIEQRKADIAVLVEKIKTDFGPSAIMDETKHADQRRTVNRLNRLTKAQRCTKKGCYVGRGWNGLNVSTGEFSLCKCTMDTIDLYVLHD